MLAWEMNSNTTLVKVKFGIDISSRVGMAFKYNTC